MVMDLKKTGLMIYQHTNQRKNLKSQTGIIVKTDKNNVYILHNTKSTDIPSAGYIQEIEQETITCPRCKQIKELAKMVLQKGPTVSGNDVKGVCEQCITSNVPCAECEEAVNTYVYILHNTKDTDMTSTDIEPEIEQTPIKCPRCRKIKEEALKVLQEGSSYKVKGICDHCKMRGSTKMSKERMRQWLTKIGHLQDKIMDDIKRGKEKKSIDKQYQKHESLKREPIIEQLFEPCKLDLATTIRFPKDTKVAHFPVVEKIETPIAFEDQLNRDMIASTSENDRLFNDQDLGSGSEDIKTVLYSPAAKEKQKSLKYPAPPCSLDSRETIVKKESIIGFEHIFKGFAPVNKMIVSASLKKSHSEEILVIKAKNVTEDQKINANRIIYPRLPRTKILTKQKSSSEIIKSTYDNLLEREMLEKKRKNTQKAEKDKQTFEATEPLSKSKKDGHIAEEDATKHNKDIQRGVDDSKKQVLSDEKDAMKAKKDSKKYVLLDKEDAMKAEKDAEKAEIDAKKAEENARKADKDALRAERNAERAEREAEKAEKEAQKAKSGAQKAESGAQKAVSGAQKSVKDTFQDIPKVGKGAYKTLEQGLKADEVAISAKRDDLKVDKVAQKAERDTLRAEKEAEKQVLKNAQNSQIDSLKFNLDNKSPKPLPKADKAAINAGTVLTQKAEKDARRAAIKSDEVTRNVLKAEKSSQKAVNDAKKAEKEAQKAEKDAQKSSLQTARVIQQAQKAEKESTKVALLSEKAAQKEAVMSASKAEKHLQRAEQAAQKETKEAKKGGIKSENVALTAEMGAQKAEKGAQKAETDAQKAEKAAAIKDEKEALKCALKSRRESSGDGLILKLVQLKQSKWTSEERIRTKPELDIEKPVTDLNMIKNRQLVYSETFLMWSNSADMSEKPEEPSEKGCIIGTQYVKYDNVQNIKEPVVRQHHDAPPSKEKQDYHKNLKNVQKDRKLENVAQKVNEAQKSEIDAKTAVTPEKESLKAKRDALKAENDAKSGEKDTSLEKEKDIFADAAAAGYLRYTLSDRKFIDNGWTLLPTEKVVRKMNVYRMRPAHPEFDWFEHNKNKRLMQYDSGEKLAEFDDNGRGRWFYRNGRMALDYYDAEELHAGQRFVVYGNGEPDERGRGRPYTLLATFDYAGNGVVFDHRGKIRLKYNQTEGVVLDRSIGPISHWKWHTLNDPPVLQQVMIDTQMTHKDLNILKMGGSAHDYPRKDNEDMLAIEFDNFIKEKSKKLSQSFKPFQIKMKALKINENFSLKVLDQATVYLIFRDGTTNLKLNIGMVLDQKEIVDTDTAEVGEVSSNMERLPARTDSLAGLQKSVAIAQHYDRMRTERERKLNPLPTGNSVDKLVAGISRPLRPPLRMMASSTTGTDCKCSRKPTTSKVYYDTRLF